jgi:hypothetical protein
MARTENRIWIELDKPPRDMHDARDRKAFYDRQCELANNVLRRLSPRADMEGQPISKFWYSEHEARYCYGGPGGYRTLSDNGEWFNLDYLGRPLTAAEDKACATIWKG